MPPYVDENIPVGTQEIIKQFKEARPRNKYRTSMIIKIALLHVLTLYTFIFKLQEMKIWTIIYSISIMLVANLGITAGAHRLWTHRSYTATWPLKLFLLCCFSISSQMGLYRWVLTHRQHHKFTDTEADPHNSKRGFFFAHMGWIMLEKTPECREEEKKIDMSDILMDPIARFHTRYFIHLVYAMLLLPSLVPIFIWNEDPFISVLATGVLRYFGAFHATGSVNSFAHFFGSKPYDKRIQPTEGLMVSFFTLGEGWHNYHHTFPWDYKAAEFGDKINLTARFLDLCGKLGLAYNFKSATPQMIENMKKKYGDGSYIPHFES